MANRVVLGAFAGTYVLRISKPGFDVLDTSLSAGNLSFDSRWSSVGKVWTKGQVPASAWSQFSSGGTPNARCSFSLGYTPGSNAPPLIIASILLNSTNGSLSGMYRPVFGIEVTLSGSTANVGILYFNKSQINTMYYTVWRPFLD
ncbi:hypothetical protein HJA82_29110 [Rhizobium bangladeshense]|uniref:hypothetical protein n=1 Tax=Rhizobium bangladeshense TaxID=1138189 RepID=UPI001C834073|nr:hypothetical protein [Rhizobium bangladeshense]MBX4911374.1 hypothetical protein [Rhizobium bangladeshense]